jgi:hypothetical protein
MDTEPHSFEKLDLDPYPLERLDPDPDPLKVKAYPKHSFK